MIPEKQSENIANFRENTVAEIDPGSVKGGSSFILVKVKTKTATESADLATLLENYYIEYYYELKSKSAHDSYAFLETQRDHVAEALQDSERTLQEFELKLGARLVPLLELTKQSSPASFSEAYKFIGAHDLFVADTIERDKSLELFEEL